MALKRGKDIVQTHYGLKDLYKYYKANSQNPLSYKEYKDVLAKCSSIIFNKILEDNDEFQIPARLGSLRIKRNKARLLLDENGEVSTKYLKMDYKRSWTLWYKLYPDLSDEEIAKIPNKQKVFHLNKHTNQAYNRFFWDKTTCNVKNQSSYAFIPIRKWKEVLVLKSRQKKIYYE